MFPDPHSKSAQLFKRAQEVMPAGNSRLTVYASPYPIYAEAGEGCWLTDVDGNRRIDCVNNMTALIHGHCHPVVVEAVKEQVGKLMTVSAPSEHEIELAEIICERLPAVDQIRFANSGTEAVMFAIRAARAFTGRSRVAKFEGLYGGSYDPMATALFNNPSNWGDPARPNTNPDGPGLSPGAMQEVVTLPFNDLEATTALIEENAAELAAVVLDLLPSRLWYGEADRSFVDGVREVTRRHGILLIVDEVMSMRLGYGGSQGEWDVHPDLTTFGKVIGGGMPIGAVGGTREVMSIFDHLNRNQFVFHGGTFNASVVSMVAGAAAMKLLTRDEVDRLNAMGDRLRAGLRSVLQTTNIAGIVQGKGSLTSFVLGEAGPPVRDHRDRMSRKPDQQLQGGFYREMLNRGVQATDGGTFILSTAMDDAIIDQVLAATQDSLRAVTRLAA